jgi:hypothetical protein
VHFRSYSHSRPGRAPEHFAAKVYDQVVAIDPVNMTVTINMINGFSFERPVWYISMDASSALAAAIEHNTLAPLMSKLPLGHDDSFASPIERIFLLEVFAPRSDL